MKFGALSSGAQGILSTFKQLQDTLENLEGELAPMVASWTGDAREAYYQQKARWEEAAAAMATILGQMGQAVDVAHSNYRAAENANLSRWA